MDQGSDLGALDGQLRSTAAVIPVAWVTDARLVSRRLLGWDEDLLGTVDYSRVELRY